MTHVENLKRGHFLVVTADKHYVEPDEPSYFSRPKPDFNGRPVQVLSVSLPFIAVQDSDSNVYSIDVRRWSFQRVTRHYAETMAGFRPADQAKRALVDKNPKRKKRPGPNDCPRCRCRMIQQYKAFQCNKICRECGYVEVV